MFVDVNVGGDCEVVQLVGFVVFFWSDEIVQVVVWFLVFVVVQLLMQMVQCYKGLVIVGLMVQMDVVYVGVGGLEVDYVVGGELFFVDDFIEYFVGVVVEFGGFYVNYFVFQDVWEFVGQFLGVEEGCLVDVFYQFVQGIFFEYFEIFNFWFWWCVVFLVWLEVVFVGLFDVDQ